MARTATKEKPEVEEIKDLELPIETGPAVHHMVRGLGRSNDGNGIFTADELDTHCQTWLERGYKLTHSSTHYNPQGVAQNGMVTDQANWHILYIFTKD